MTPSLPPPRASRGQLLDGANAVRPFLSKPLVVEGIAVIASEIIVVIFVCIAIIWWLT